MAMILIDTTAYSAFNRGNGQLKQWFVKENEIIVPLIVIGELRAGFKVGNKELDNERLLQRFLDSPNVLTATLTDKTTKIYRDIYSQLRQKGTPINTNDMWIAAIALERGCKLIALDRDFTYIPSLDLHFIKK